MRLPVVVALASLIAIPAFAQNDPPSPAPSRKPPAQPPRTGSIIGTVMCGDTHKPARGAMVMVMPLPEPAGRANDEGQSSRNSETITRVASDGTFTSTHLIAGEYTVIVMLPGYLSGFDSIMQAELQDHSPETQRKALRELGTLNVTASGATHTEITLQRGAAVSGRVLYSDGAPATQVNIDVQNIDTPPVKPNPAAPEDELMAGMAGSVKSMFTHQTQSTDDQGHFRIAGLAPGKYRVAAVEATPNPLSDLMGGNMGMAALFGGGSRATDLHVFAGDTLHRKDAKVYDLRAGDEVPGIDITIPANAFHRVSGRLASKDGRGINAGKLLLTDAADDTLVFTGTLSRDGSFAFASVPSGTYNLSATGAQLLSVPDSFPDGMPMKYSGGKITNAFADGTLSILVKDSDVPDVHLTLTEVPLPPHANDDQAKPPIDVE